LIRTPIVSLSARANSDSSAMIIRACGCAVSNPSFTDTSRPPAFSNERWFRELTDKALRRGVFHSVPDLIAKIEEYLAAHNDDPKPFVWTATADDILTKVARGRVALQAVNQ
jgi:hypothetical protein